MRKAAERLAELGVDVELIDVRTLLPFDRNHLIVESLKKTNRLLVVDEDVPGGASAYILQQILEVQGGYRWLDSAPTHPHRQSPPPGIRQRWRLLQQAQRGGCGGDGAGDGTRVR